MKLSFSKEMKSQGNSLSSILSKLVVMDINFTCSAHVGFSFLPVRKVLTTYTYHTYLKLANLLAKIETSMAQPSDGAFLPVEAQSASTTLCGHGTMPTGKNAWTSTGKTAVHCISSFAEPICITYFMQMHLMCVRIFVIKSSKHSIMNLFDLRALLLLESRL